MTAPLDEKGWEATMRRIRDYTMDAESKKWWLRFCEAQQDLHAAEARIKALEEAQEMEVVGFMHPTADWCHRLYSEIDMHCPKDGPRPVALITLSSAQSALAAMSEKLAIAERNRDAGRDNFHTMQQSAADLAAQVLRLTEENEALRKERDGLAAEMRSIPKGCVIDCDLEVRSGEKEPWLLHVGKHTVVARLVDYRIMPKERYAEIQARIKALEEALREISKDEVHTAFGAKPARGAEVARSTLQKEQADG